MNFLTFPNLFIYFGFFFFSFCLTRLLKKIKKNSFVSNISLRRCCSTRIMQNANISMSLSSSFIVLFIAIVMYDYCASSFFFISWLAFFSYFSLSLSPSYREKIVSYFYNAVQQLSTDSKSFWLFQVKLIWWRPQKARNREQNVKSHYKNYFSKPSFSFAPMRIWCTHKIVNEKKRKRLKRNEQAVIFLLRRLKINF